MNDLHVLEIGYWKEVDKCYKQIKYLIGNNLEELQLSQLDELEAIYLNGLKAVSQAKQKLALANEAALKQEILKLKNVITIKHEDSLNTTIPIEVEDQEIVRSEKKKKKSHISFGTVEVRVMNREPGEGIPHNGGAPLGLGWNIISEQVHNINSFEEQRGAYRRAKYSVLGSVPEPIRENILRKAGVCEEELNRERNSIDKINRERAETNQESRQHFLQQQMHTQVNMLNNISIPPISTLPTISTLPILIPTMTTTYTKL